jgi:energy-coupling factor transporter ATP-binding protein EcfA2
MTETPATKTVLETILDWSQDRPVWQRDALRRIVGKGKLDDNDIAELVALCKQGRGRAASGMLAQPLEQRHLPATPGAHDSVSLLAVKDVSGANALAPSQSLQFAQTGLTIIYGDNGAGKSGYARILKRACRARHRGVIHGNIYAAPSSSPAAATLEYAIGGAAKPPEKWQDGENPHRVLSAVSVFDSDCAATHIGRENDVAFRPSGLDVPDALADACRRVKEVLVAEQKQHEKAKHPSLLKPSWKDTTAVGKALVALKHDTDLAQLQTLATLTEEDRARVDTLKANLSKEPSKAAAEQKVKADNIKRALDTLASVEAATSDSALEAVFTDDRTSKVKREAARAAAENAFSTERLREIGADAWRTLWDAARRYSAQAYPGRPFPVTQEDALCVLCQQPLGPEAKERLNRFETFIKEDTERQAQDAEKTAKASRRKLADHPISTSAIVAGLDEIALHDPAKSKALRRFIASTRLRRYATLKAIAGVSNQLDNLPALAPDTRADIAVIEKRIRADAEESRKAAEATERKKLEAELAELSDRMILAEMTQVVTDEIARLQALYFLGQCVDDTNSRAITDFGTGVADTHITPQLRDRFYQEIHKLAAAKIRVEIVRSSSRQGSPQYQVRFVAKPDAKVTDVLSEGEKTCVALAAFLTELATAPHCSTLVFDDPVSSLDHRWRRQVAKRLVEEITIRQIIVFTHDLVFVHDLLDSANAKGQSSIFLTVSREESGPGVVTDGLPWTAATVEDRLDKLGKEARAAKPHYDSNRDAQYASAAVQFYNRLRATWERAIEEVAFAKIVRRHRDYIDTKHLKKVSVLTEPDCDSFRAGFKKCCDVVDSHDPSIGRNAAPPPYNELLADLKTLEDWVASIKDRQKQFA